MKKALKNRIRALLPAVLLCLLFAACAPEKEVTLKKTVYAMDTVMNLTVTGKNAEAALNEAEKEIFRLEALLNRHKETSTVAQLNGSGSIEEEELAGLLTRVLEMSRSTDGAFDCTVAPLLDAWDISGKGRVPGEEEIASLLLKTGCEEKVQVEGGRITLAPGTCIDLGGAGKGYAGERVRAIYEKYGVTGSIALGGDNCLVGPKSAEAPLWRVGLRDPGSEDGLLGILTVTDTFTVTSGSYERFFTGEDGTVYHHILDPETGSPARSGLVSVTVLTKDGVFADSLATALFVMGADKAKVWLGEHPEVSAILVTEDARVLYSASLAETFTPQNGSYTFETF